PGRRDYVWTVDTLFMPFNSFTDITGTSPTNVWACGPGGDLDKTFYHYNGQSWNTDLIPRPISPLSVSSNSINFVLELWIRRKNLKYCGNEWLEQYVYFANTDTLVVLQEIFIISENDIYTIADIYFA
ncbi:MAG: hypothetical protein M5T52_22995, partial [Ignavibacteriaceae bacterium]|nr:hypothetical protein [Ignavibacteriaceae bacterium]